MYKTDDNLKSAFATECQAYVRYTLYAARADADGQPDLARLFRAAAEAEFIHARNHFGVMGGLGTTRDNLLAAATAEHYEMTRVYPGFLEDAQVDRNERARITFDYALKSEQEHNRIFEKVLAEFKAGQPAPAGPDLVCQMCGNLVIKDVPGKCPVCGNADKYREVK